MSAPANRRVQRTIIGSPLELQNALETADRQGRLVAVTPPRPYAPGRFAVTAVLVETAPPTPVAPAERPAQRRPPARRPWTVAATLAAVLAALMMLGAVLAVALEWVLTHLGVLLGAAVVLAGAAWLLRVKTQVCMGLHCEGCGHR